MRCNGLYKVAFYIQYTLIERRLSESFMKKESQEVKIGRNDKCYCGSGVKYKNCHLEVDVAISENKYDVSQRIYLKRWGATSEFFHKKDYYHWMERGLLNSKPKRILDIGCGSGRGICALYDVLGPEIQVISSR